jgi:hypothetical protein
MTTHTLLLKDREPELSADLHAGWWNLRILWCRPLADRQYRENAHEHTGGQSKLFLHPRSLQCRGNSISDSTSVRLSP